LKVFFIEQEHNQIYDDIMADLRREQNKTVESSGQADEVQAAVDYGIDIEMLIDNIKRGPGERIRRHQTALNTAEKLREAKHK
jgi:F0F1-type ATP synthase beta subunit